MILAAMVIARNPTQYGFTPMATDKPLAYDSVTRHPRRRPAPRRRVDRHAARSDPGAQPRAAPLDDAGARRALRRQGAGRHRRQAARAAGQRAGRPSSRRSTGIASSAANRSRRSRASWASAAAISPKRTGCRSSRGCGPARICSCRARRPPRWWRAPRPPPRPPATRAPPRRPRRAASGRPIRRAARAWSTRCAAATRSRRSPAPSTPRSPRSSRPTGCAAATSPPAIASRSTAPPPTARATQYVAGSSTGRRSRVALVAALTPQRASRSVM